MDIDDNEPVGFRYDPQQRDRLFEAAWVAIEDER